MKHPFLTDQEISQIIENLEKKKKRLESNLPSLVEIAKTSEREKTSSDDGGVFETLLLEQSIANDSLSRTKTLINKCNETLLQIKNCPEIYGFDKKTKLPLPVEVLICNPLCDALPPEYGIRKVTQKM